MSEQGRSPRKSAAGFTITPLSGSSARAVACPSLDHDNTTRAQPDRLPTANPTSPAPGDAAVQRDAVSLPASRHDTIRYDPPYYRITERG
jgi:hypothetical protein